MELGLGVEHLRVALDGVVIKSYIYNKALQVRQVVGVNPLCCRLRRWRGSGAEVGSKGDGCDEKKDANRDANAIAKSANVVRAEKTTRVTRAVHDGRASETGEGGGGIEKKDNAYDTRSG